MDEPIDKAGICRRLAKLGLREAGDRFRDEVRKRLRAEGATREAANEGAWQEMADTFLPAAERAEGKAAANAELPAPQLPGMPAPANINAAIDPAYNEPDPGKRLRDGLLWTVEQWMRVIADTETGPVATLAAASVPPPNPFALMVLSTYALSPLDKRRELITRALAFATKAHDADSTEGDQPQTGFLGDVD
jgi:hypothetical protein